MAFLFFWAASAAFYKDQSSQLKKKKRNTDQRARGQEGSVPFLPRGWLAAVCASRGGCPPSRESRALCGAAPAAGESPPEGKVTAAELHAQGGPALPSGVFPRVPPRTCWNSVSLFAESVRKTRREGLGRKPPGDGVTRRRGRDDTCRPAFGWNVQVGPGAGVCSYGGFLWRFVNVTIATFPQDQTVEKLGDSQPSQTGCH